LCELALWQVPKHIGHTNGGFVQGTNVGNLQDVLSGVRAALQPLKISGFGERQLAGGGPY
jgi:hypothetical protein